MTTYVLMEVGEGRLETIFAAPTIDDLLTIVRRVHKAEVADAICDEDIDYYTEQLADLECALDKLRGHPAPYYTELEIHYPRWNVLATDESNFFDESGEWV